MQKRTVNSQALINLEGKQIRNVNLMTAHGDVFEICFEDGTSLKVCTTFGLIDDTVEPNVDDLYITINDKPIIEHTPIPATMTLP